ncbi:MAG: type II toxin-antitoxin system RelE/ParE family toxin [Clostridia bacterium]
MQNNNNKTDRIKLNKIIAYMRMLEEKGLALGEPYIKHISGNIWEMRPLRDRILFATLENNKFIILNQFIKMTQKTPRREIEKAKRILENYKKGVAKNE